MDLKKIPKELLKSRETTECNFIFCLYKNIELVSDYKNIQPNEDIITDDGVFYYGLILLLDKAGYSCIDNITIYSFLEKNQILRDGFEKRGGWQEVQEITNLLSTDNIEVYYDELVKSNLLIRLHEKGFNVLSNLEKFQQMSSDEIYDYFEYQLADTIVGKIEKAKAEDLNTGYAPYIDEWDKGLSVGYPISSRILGSMLQGLHNSNLTLHLAGIGQGKTTTAILLYVLPAIEHGENCLICCNEQTVDEFRKMLLGAVLFNKIGAIKGMNRQKLIKGHFTEEQREALDKAAAWLENQSGKVTFIEMQNYDVQSLKRVISKYSRIGYGLVIVDTLKQVDDAAEKAYGAFSEAAKSLFLLAKQTHTAIVCTAQLATDSLSRKYLDLSSVGKSRSISETATAVIGFRPVFSDEYDKIKPYNWEKQENGKRIMVKTELKSEERYIIVFVMKNRWGNVAPQIVMKFNQDFLRLEDVGYYDVPFDNFRRN